MPGWIESPKPHTGQAFGAQLRAVETRKRPYRQQRRAQARSETRRRIVEATVALHGTVGPARTTVTAIAELAGVQRHTVYDHFPDEPALLAACSAHFLALNPVPDVNARSAADACRVLRDLYEYYCTNRDMVGTILRDGEVMKVGAGFLALRDAAACSLAPYCLGAPPRTRDALAVLACSFSTWSRLDESGLSPRQAAELMAGLLRGATGA